MTKLLPKNIKEIDFLKITQKCENGKRKLMSSTSNISASTLPNIKSKDSFEILRHNGASWTEG